MLRTMLQTKLHRVRVTEADRDYEGSCGIECALLEGPGTISLNGAAARKAVAGDLMIICAYAQYADEELPDLRPRIVLVDTGNRPRAL